MQYTLDLLDIEIKYIQSKINKEPDTHITELTTTINKNILKELITMKQFIRDNYPKLKTFYT